MKTLLLILSSIIAIPIYLVMIYVALTTFNLSIIYAGLMPVVLIAGSLYLKNYFQKNIYFLPLFLFIILQFIPLPRSPYMSYGGELGPPARQEPFAIGIGYPFSNVKLFLGYGCIASTKKSFISIKGNFVDLPLEQQKCGGYLDYSGNPYIRITSPQVKSDSAPDVIYPGDIVFFPLHNIWPGVFEWFPLFLWSWFAWIVAIEKRKK